MKIFPNYIANVNIVKNHNPNFTSDPVSDKARPQTETISNVRPDYNIKTPIGYNLIDDIKLNNEITAKYYKLANGQKVIIVPKEGATVVKSYVNTGSFNEPDNIRGISHYIEHNLFNGSEDLGDLVFFEEVNKMGASTNASTDFSCTDYYIASTPLTDSDLEDKIRLHAGMLQTPKFLLEKLEKEKNIVNSEINMCVSENENLGFTQTLKNLFNIDSTSLDLIAGNTDNITALTRDDVVNYFNNNYYPANITTVITGDVDPDKAITLISKYFNSTKTPQGQRIFEKMTPLEKPIRQDLISQKSDSGATSVFLGFVGPQNNNTKDKIHTQALCMLATRLYSSRFAEIERNYGINIGLHTQRLSSNPNEKTVLMLETRIPEDKSEQIIKHIYKLIDNLVKNPPTEEELTTLKNNMKKDYDLMFEDSYILNSVIGGSFLNDTPEYIKDYTKIVDEMTIFDIQNCAQKFLKLDKSALTVVHPKGTSIEDINQKYNEASKISFTGSDKKTPINMNNITTYKTDNNFDITLNNTTTNTIHYDMSISQPEWTIKSAVLAEVLTDMFDNAGTSNKTINEIAKKEDLIAMGSGINATLSSIDVYADFPIDSTKDALEIIKDRIQNPNLSQEEFESSIRRLKDYYKNIEVNPYDKFKKGIFKQTPMCITSKEKLENLDKISLEDVKQFYNEILNSGQANVTVSAPFETHPELKQEIFNSITSYNNVKPWNLTLKKAYNPIEKTEVYTDISLKNQADIIEGFKYKRNGNIKDEICISILNEILGHSTSSRLFTDLRETRHLAYSVGSDYECIGDLGVFKLHIGTTTENQETGEQTFENVQKAIDGFNENIYRITTEKVTEEELEAAKKRAKTDLLDFLETNEGKNTLLKLAKNTPYGVNYINLLYENIDSITSDDVYNTARNIFNSKPIYSITATKETLDANKEYLENLEK